MVAPIGMVDGLRHFVEIVLLGVAALLPIVDISRHAFYPLTMPVTVARVRFQWRSRSAAGSTEIATASV